MHFGERKVFLLLFLVFLLIPASSISPFPLILKATFGMGEPFIRNTYKKHSQRVSSKKDID